MIRITPHPHLYTFLSSEGIRIVGIRATDITLESYNDYADRFAWVQLPDWRGELSRFAKTSQPLW